MGWTSSEDWRTPSQARDEVRSNLQFNNIILGEASVAYGRRYYAAVRPKARDPLAQGLGERFGGVGGDSFIVVALIHGSPRGGGYAIKVMDESMGPCEVDCPLNILELVKDSPAEGYGVEWREKVRQFHARRRSKVKPGDKVYTSEGDTDPYTVTRIIKRSLIGLRASHTREYRIPRGMIHRVEAA